MKSRGRGVVRTNQSFIPPRRTSVAPAPDVRAQTIPITATAKGFSGICHWVSPPEPHSGQVDYVGRFFFTSKRNNNININNSILARSHNAFKKTSCSTRRSLHTPKHGNYTRGTTADYNRLKRVSLICRYYYY